MPLSTFFTPKINSNSSNSSNNNNNSKANQGRKLSTKVAPDVDVAAKVDEDALGKLKVSETRAAKIQYDDIENDFDKVDPYQLLGEAMLFVFFLAVFLVATLSLHGGEEHYFYSERMAQVIGQGAFRSSDVFNDYPKTFHGIQKLEDVWLFLKGPFYNTVFQHQWYNGDEFTPEEQGMIMSYNRLLGGVRLRTLRVKPDSCIIRDEYKSVLKYCFGDLNEASMSTTGFGPVLNSQNISTNFAHAFAFAFYERDPLRLENYTALLECTTDCGRACQRIYGYEAHRYILQCSDACDINCNCFYLHGLNVERCPNPAKAALVLTPSTTTTDPALDQREIELIHTYNWRSAAELNESSTWGTLGWLSGSGYVVDLPINATQAWTALQRLEANRFIDLATRVLFIDLTVFNAHLSLFHVLRYTLEFPPSGGILPTASHRVLDIYGYSYGVAWRLLWEILLVLFVGMQWFNLIHGIAVQGMVTFFLHDYWNAVDVAYLVLFQAAIGLRLYAIDRVYGIFGSEPMEVPQVTDIPHLYHLVNIEDIERIVLAIIATLMWFKLLKYGRISYRMHFLLRVLHRASTDVFFFSLILLIIFVGMGQAGFLAFSSDVESFRTLGHSIMTLFRSIKSELNYEAMANSNFVYGPMFYLLFYVLVLLLLINVFLAILNDAYLAVRKEDLPLEEYQIRQRYLFSGGWKESWNNLMIGFQKLSPFVKFKVLKRSSPSPVRPPVTAHQIADGIASLEDKIHSLIEINQQRKKQIESLEDLLVQVEKSTKRVRRTRRIPRGARPSGDFEDEKKRNGPSDSQRMSQRVDQSGLRSSPRFQGQLVLASQPSTSLNNSYTSEGAPEDPSAQTQFLDKLILPPTFPSTTGERTDENEFMRMNEEEDSAVTTNRNSREANVDV